MIWMAAWSLQAFAGEVVEGARLHLGGRIEVSAEEQVTSVTAVGGAIRVDGVVYGAATAVGGHIEIGPSAVVYGAATAVGGWVEVAPGAIVHGAETSLGPRPRRVRSGWGRRGSR